MEYKTTVSDARTDFNVVYATDLIEVYFLLFSALIQTGSETHPASYTMGTGSLSRG
jgi:hypothetical protein